MKKIFKYLFLIIVALVVVSILYERIFLVKRYKFEFDDLNIKVVSDECESCFLDWSINNTIIIENKKTKKTIKEEFYTEGPQIEFGISDSNNNILISCPGFNHLIFEKNSLTKIEDTQSSSKDLIILLNYAILYKINKQKELIKINRSKPSVEW